ncbi:hypothetical protein NIES4101_30010 [Calothrix sp. NIES-4101]|nr:hypothetical protein NIES4101_30010 [Calothrix sp. NIES-4101]
MENTQDISSDLNMNDNIKNLSLAKQNQYIINLPAIFKKIRGGFFLVIGFLLSPMSWWNDLFFNLPIAYGFGYLCSLFSKDLLFPCAIAGYWLSNVLGILLMQAGVMDVLPNQSSERNLKQELLTGLASSTAYTLAILALIHFKILETPNLFPGS